MLPFGLKMGEIFFRHFFTKKSILEMFVQSGFTPTITDKILLGNEYWRLKYKLFNIDSCVAQFIIKAKKTPPE